MEAVLLFATVLAPIVLALIELVKKTLTLRVTLLPLIAFVIGLGIGALSWPFTDMDLTLRLWAGGFAGLSATGIFELIKPRSGQTKEGK